MRYLIVLTLCGCAATRWTHPSKSEQDFYADSVNCERMAAGTYPGPGWADAGNRSDLTERCLRAQGWRR